MKIDLVNAGKVVITRPTAARRVVVVVVVGKVVAVAVAVRSTTRHFVAARVCACPHAEVFDELMPGANN